MAVSGLRCCQSIVSRSSSLHQATMASAFSYPAASASPSSSYSPSSSSSYSVSSGRSLRLSNRSALFGGSVRKQRLGGVATSRRCYGASSEGFSDEEFAKSLKELWRRFPLAGGEGQEDAGLETIPSPQFQDQDNFGGGEDRIESDFSGLTISTESFGSADRSWFDFLDSTTAMERAEGEGNGEAAEELKLWDSMVEEARRLRQRDLGHGTTLRCFVSPIAVELQPEDSADYLPRELLYHRALSEEPENPLILSNYAQFLYLAVHDHDRAEEYFQRSVAIDPADAESLCRYANFLWQARNNIAAAEEIFLKSIEAAPEPINSSYAAQYAHFLWNTGGDDTCFPLYSPDHSSQESV